MISRRSTIVVSLMVVPVLTYVIVAGWALWATGRFGWVWWMAPACWVLAWCVSRFWPTGKAEQSGMPIPTRWTPRDHEAARIVREFQEKVEQLTPAELTDFSIYQNVARSLAIDLARHYHPQARDPVSSLTVPEVLAAVRLAVDDMEQWMLSSVPGSHLLTIKQWRALQSAPKWIRRFQNATWVASILLNPVNIAGYLTSKFTVDPATDTLQAEFLGALYVRFVDRIGFYLIEMNSGRLRGGADAYRRAFPTESGRSPSREGGRSALDDAGVQPLTVALVGQVSSGKSSLVNALTGSRQAAVDILPETRHVARYQMAIAEPPVVLTLLDTPGYGEMGATTDQLRQIRSALQESNAVLVVMAAHSPAREADRRTLHELEEWYASQPRLKPPPLIGVLTHVDLLRPALEWSPPYEWREPKGQKEQSIHDAVGYVRELFGGTLAGAVPVCADARPERAWGILEEVLPALTLVLSDAQSAALLRTFECELDHGRLKTLLNQIKRCGSDLLQCWLQERSRSEPIGAQADNHSGIQRRTAEQDRSQ